MQIAYTPTQRDFIEIQRAHAWRRYSRTMAKLQRGAEPFVGIAFVVYGVFALTQWHAMFSGPFLIAIGLYTGLASRIFAPLLYKRAFRRRHFGDPSPVTFDISESEIHCTVPGKSDSRIEWAMICGHIESDKVVLLYTAPGMFVGIPKHALSEENLSELSEILQQRKIAVGYPR